MRSIRIFFIVLFITGLSCAAFGRGCDTTKANDTTVVPRDKIQIVEIACNTSSIIAKPKMIGSQREFNKFFGKDCHTTPPIDFSKQTLLFFPTKTIGCKADYARTVKISENSVVYHITISLHEGCGLPIFNSNSIAVPKIDSMYTPHFQKSEISKKDTK